MIRYWEEAYRQIPVFTKVQPGEQLAEFLCTPEGFNSIVLATNQDLTDRELMGVLLHEMCHHVVFEEYGYDVTPHGFEWMAEMMRVGFEDPDWESDGCDFFSEEEYQSILELLPKEEECE
tara:strand:- start:1489 stop:1848 length:360 start_codon:yes stop_codon:yes gene_type:complete